MARKIIFILSLLFVVSVLFGQNAKLHVKTGEQFMLNGMYDAALVEFTKAINLEPGLGKAYANIATVKLIKGDTISAAENYRKAAVLGEKPEENYLNSTVNYYQIKNYNEALSSVNAGLAIKQKSFELWLLKAKINYDLGDYTTSKNAAVEAIKNSNQAIAYYYSGLSSYKLKEYQQAEDAFNSAIIQDKDFAEVYTALARLQNDLGKYDLAIDNCSRVILLLNPDNIDALIERSRAFNALKEPELAISDITKAISLDKNKLQFYLLRGKYNFDCALYSNAVDDFSVALVRDDTLTEAHLYRAMAFESLGKIVDAKNDYRTLKSLLINSNDSSLKNNVDAKLFELEREENKPELVINQPLVTEKMEFIVKNTEKSVLIKGLVKDESDISVITINNSALTLSKSELGGFEFEKQLNTENLDFVTISVVDIYNNTTTESFPILYAETEAPVIRLISPAAEGNNIIHLETGDNTLYIDGKIEDASTITSIKIDDINASFAPNDYNPRFMATIDIKNRKNITFTVVDKFNNKTEQTFEFARDGYLLSGNNPMGKTWVVIIENSDYKEFSTLSKSEEDVASLKNALARYKVSKVLHMKNMSKREMERFFALDLRDLIVTNNVNSLMIWYAGHGKFINNTGYWIPIDARYNDEYSFYNVNALKASLYSYLSLSHLLIISDACAAGESFSIALRGDNSLANCDDANLVKQKSALVLTSSNNEAALDNSLFAETFVNALENNPADCIPIDAIAERITLVMQKYTVQKPVFGRISGLENNSGTFFFIAR